MLSFFRVITFAFQDIARNLGLTLMTVFVLVLTLLSANTFFMIKLVTEEATKSVKDQIDVSIYFKPDAPEEKIQEVLTYMNAQETVATATYYSKEASLERFKQSNKSKAILQSIEELGENPLGATLIVKTKQPGDYKKVLEGLNVPEYEKIIETKTFTDTEQTIRKVDVVTERVEQASLILIIFFAIIAFLIILNTIRVSIYTQRAEISIKKLVGATNWFIQGPYIVISFIYTLVSVGITGFALYGIMRFADPYLSVVLGTHNLLTDYFSSNILILFFSELGAVFALTLISTLLAMRRYLHV